MNDDDLFHTETQDEIDRIDKIFAETPDKDEALIACRGNIADLNRSFLLTPDQVKLLSEYADKKYFEKK